MLSTFGLDGMMVCNIDGLISSVKTVAKEVLDVIGAGDTSIAYEVRTELAIDAPREVSIKRLDIEEGEEVKPKKKVIVVRSSK